MDCPLSFVKQISDGFPEKLEEETYERWRERCREKEKSYVLNAGKLLRDSNQVITSRSSLLKHKTYLVKNNLKFANFKCSNYHYFYFQNVQKWLWKWLQNYLFDYYNNKKTFLWICKLSVFGCNRNLISSLMKTFTFRTTFRTWRPSWLRGSLLWSSSTRKPESKLISASKYVTTNRSLATIGLQYFLTFEWKKCTKED